MAGYQPLAAVIESVQEVQQQERTGELDCIKSEACDLTSQQSCSKKSKSIFNFLTLFNTTRDDLLCWGRGAGKERVGFRVHHHISARLEGWLARLYLKRHVVIGWSDTKL